MELMTVFVGAVRWGGVEKRNGEVGFSGCICLEIVWLRTSWYKVSRGICCQEWYLKLILMGKN